MEYYLGSKGFQVNYDHSLPQGTLALDLRPGWVGCLIVLLVVIVLKQFVVKNEPKKDFEDLRTNLKLFTKPIKFRFAASSKVGFEQQG